MQSIDETKDVKRTQQVEQDEDDVRMMRASSTLTRESSVYESIEWQRFDDADGAGSTAGAYGQIQEEMLKQRWMQSPFSVRRSEYDSHIELGKSMILGHDGYFDHEPQRLVLEDEGLYENLSNNLRPKTPLVTFDEGATWVREEEQQDISQQEDKKNLWGDLRKELTDREGSVFKISNETVSKTAPPSLLGVQAAFVKRIEQVMGLYTGNLEDNHGMAYLPADFLKEDTDKRDRKIEGLKGLESRPGSKASNGER